MGTPTTQQGLLSFALVYNGLEEGRADFRPTDLKIGWLRYGMERVPQLYWEYKQGKATQAGARMVEFDGRTRRARRVAAGGIDVTDRTQRPALFSYRRGADPVLVNW
jgi:hypothetical protein